MFLNTLLIFASKLLLDMGKLFSKDTWGKGGSSWTAAGAIGGTLGSINTGEKRGMWDTLDPVHHLAGGRETGAGNAMGDAGVAVTQAGLSSGNPWLMAAGAGLKVVGGLANAAFGIKEDTTKKQAVEAGINQNMNFLSDASSFDDVRGPAAVMTNTDVYKGGWFSGSKARRKNEELKKRLVAANLFANRSVDNNIFNLQNDQMNSALANYSAFGGPIDMAPSMDGAALDYGLALDYLNTKRINAENKNKMTNVLAGTPRGLFALGGDLQANGSDWSTGLSHIDAGGSHSENPNEGVQLGVDSQNVPNLVEEGETVYDDYVFSNRILVDAATKQLFRLPKKKDITFADISKRLEKEIAERPNDPISRAGFERQMAMLEEQQERQKHEMEAERAKAAFEAMTPEQQVAVMDNAAQQEAMAQQAAMQQPSPEEIAMAQQQQQLMADNSEPNLGQEPQINCFGGKVNRFDNGGKAYTRMLNTLGFHTKSDFEKWAKENNIDFGDLWKDNEGTLDYNVLSGLWKNEKFKEALRKQNPVLAHAFEDKGFDFGFYEPETKDKATIQSINKGNWKTTNGKGWRGSEDLAFKQATEGLSDEEIDALTTEQLAERMKNTEAYQNTNRWLQNSDNALMYLNTLINDPDTPQVAKDYAAKYVKDGKWTDGFNYDYATVFGSNGKGVRETNPGTYWHTAMEANRGNQTGNFVINEDGSIEPIVGSVPTDWASAGNYNWSDENNDYAYNYYKRPVVTTPTSTPALAETPEEEETPEVNPVHKAEWLRYAGLFGPAVGLGMMAAGVGKPDTASLDAAVEGAGNVRYARYKPLGNYLTYRPLDIWYEQNRLNANARATERGIMNSGANQGSKTAGLLAAGYNNQIASGNLFRQAQEYNDALRERVAQFNRGTDQYNSEQYGATSRFNAGAYNDANRAARQLRLQAAAQKMDADAGWYNSLYGNIGALTKGIADIGVENKRDNMINWMISKGIFGAVDPNDPEMKKRVRVVSAEGGQAKRKKNKRKGLTF